MLSRKDILSERAGTRDFQTTDGSTFKAKNMLDQIFLEVTERYNISDDVIKAFQTGEMPQNLSEEEETRFAYELKLLNSEMMALGSEYVLGSEEMIDRLVESERGTARKMLRRIKDRIALIENAFKGDKSANAALKELRKAEKLFSDALAASGEKYLHKAYVDRNEEKKAQEAELDNSENVQYSKNDVLSKEEYERFGWVRANDLLSSSEWKDFTSKYASIKTGATFPTTKGGETIIATTSGQGQNAVDNILVYAKGDIASPEVTRIYKIDLDNETDLDERRRELYACERRGIQQEAGDIFRRYTPSDYGYNEYASNIQAGKSHNSGDGQQRGRSGAQTQRVTGYHFNEDGSTTVTYADGTSEVQYSLRDSEGRALTPEQAAFFKDSKVVDKDGRLQVVYHGTNADFNTFDYFKTKGGKLGYARAVALDDIHT